jgi:hypothetical protein
VLYPCLAYRLARIELSDAVGCHDKVRELSDASWAGAEVRESLPRTPAQAHRAASLLANLPAILAATGLAATGLAATRLAVPLLALQQALLALVY